MFPDEWKFCERTASNCISCATDSVLPFLSVQWWNFSPVFQVAAKITRPFKEFIQHQSKETLLISFPEPRKISVNFFPSPRERTTEGLFAPYPLIPWRVQVQRLSTALCLANYHSPLMFVFFSTVHYFSSLIANFLLRQLTTVPSPPKSQISPFSKLTCITRCMLFFICRLVLLIQRSAVNATAWASLPAIQS